jgi:hypothetical protein
MEKKKNNPERSICCGAKVVIRGKTTKYYVCLACGKPCDVYLKERRTWAINPTTRVKGDERAKIKQKEIDKEIKEIGHA